MPTDPVQVTDPLPCAFGASVLGGAAYAAAAPSSAAATATIEVTLPQIARFIPRLVSSNVNGHRVVLGARLLLVARLVHPARDDPIGPALQPDLVAELPLRRTPGSQQNRPATVALRRELPLAVHEAAVLALHLRDRHVDALEVALRGWGVRLAAAGVAGGAAHREALRPVLHPALLQRALRRRLVLARAGAALHRPVRDPRGVDLLPRRVPVRVRRQVRRLGVVPERDRRCVVGDETLVVADELARGRGGRINARIPQLVGHPGVEEGLPAM